MKQTLAMEKMAAEGGQHPNHHMTLSGSVAVQVVKEPGGWLARLRKGGTPIITGRCCGVCLMVVLMTVVFVMAFLALVLVLSVMTQAYPVCDCTATTLRLELDNIISRITALENSSAPNNVQTTETPVELRVELDDIRSRITALESSDSSNSLQLGTNYTSVISGFNLFDNCTTVGVISCVGITSCETFVPGTPLHLPGWFTVGARCVRELRAATDMSATLEIVETQNQAICVCNSPSGGGVNCTLQITRCPVPQTIRAEFVVSNSP